MRYYEILCEAKVTDARHEESTLKHWGSSKYNYIKPSDGFFFTYRGGLLVLHSEENEVYSSKVSGNCINNKNDTLIQNILGISKHRKTRQNCFVYP